MIITIVVHMKNLVFNVLHVVVMLFIPAYLSPFIFLPL
ncbi:unnamed protein product [Enterobius vermicularis]|uniref:Uncharacterized protein n=1 Tax=Enterobius vermicularis TaxID=51028 RepID=A0A0N4V3J0_ENTVE|nr:unnamed protein product [Enterobius vermicularis]